MTAYIKTETRPPTRTAGGISFISTDDLGGSDFVTRTAAPAQEDMPNRSAAFWVDASLNRLMVAFNVDGDYGSVVVVPFDEV